MATRIPGATIAEKLMLNHRIDGECWRWTRGHSSTGYGQMTVAGKKFYVHRLSHETFIGPIPEGMEVDHQCNVPDCINPAHLKAMPHRDNLLRSPTGVVAVFARRTHCKNGHEFTPENTALLKGRGRRCRTCKRARDSRYRVARRSVA